jgi:hypothetical protein
MGRLGRVAVLKPNRWTGKMTLHCQVLRVTNELALQCQCSLGKVGELTTAEGGPQ